MVEYFLPRPTMDVNTIMNMANFSGMASNSRFCSLDMLAEVASLTLRNDISLITEKSFQNNKNKSGSSSPRKSVSTCEKLSLDQIKNLSEKNLVEMFSEPECDEMKKNYSFQCILVPDECSQVFKSFGNEDKARCRIKDHLLAHICELNAAAEDPNNREVFMAEPLHARKRRLQDVSGKNTRKKKRNKLMQPKEKKDSDEFSMNVDDDQISTAIQSSPEMECDEYDTEINCANDNDSSSKADKLRYLHFPSDGPVYDSSADRVILKGQSSITDSSFLKCGIKKKCRSKHLSDSSKRTSSTSQSNVFLKSSSEGDISHMKTVAHLEYKPCSPVHHDHTYPSIIKEVSLDLLSGNETSKPASKVCKNSPHSKRASHQSLQKESPLVIPTPPFPFVYIPLLPHIAAIQEVGLNLKPPYCKYPRDNVTKGLSECNYSPDHVPLLLPKENACPVNSVSQSKREDGESAPSHIFVEGMSDDRSNNKSSDIKVPDPSFCIDELLRPECPENLRAMEKV